MALCLISLGSNMGDRDALMRSAIEQIIAEPNVRSIQCSRVFTTPPVGGPKGQSPFLNAVAVLETTLGTDGVLKLLQQTEHSLGRVRKQRWDQRRIDLDVVLYGDFVGATLRLKLPHPRYTARTFVLAPAQDVASDWCDPRFGWSLQQLYEHLQKPPASIALVGGDAPLRREICQQVASRYDIDIRQEEQTSRPWVADFVPDAIYGMSPADASDCPGLPRLIARLHQTTPQSHWPSPQFIYPQSWCWPEYRLDVDDLDWAVSEVAAAIDSMQCDVHPVTSDGNWWKTK
ncbi:MAG: 2-amino-4-hydroxy-6-hydroxymethyldihydropteridine diphosphokinase [Pirellulaceae bacterium]